MSASEISKTVALFDRPVKRKIIENLRQEDSALLLIETPIIKPLESSAETNAILDELSKYDWLILTDIFATEILIERLETAGIDLFQLDNLRICAAGESIADLLRYSQIHADAVSLHASSPEIFESLKNYENHLQGKKIILPLEKDSSPEITKFLQNAQVQITELPIYQTLFENRENLTKSKIKLSGGAADEFIFSSPSEVSFLAKIFEAENLASFMTDVQTIALDPVTYQALREFGISNAILKVGDFSSGEVKVK